MLSETHLKICNRLSPGNRRHSISTIRELPNAFHPQVILQRKDSNGFEGSDHTVA